MPQKPLKISKKAVTLNKRSVRKQGPRKAAPKQIASKKKALQIAKKLNKAASLTAATEKLVAAKVGHLELVPGARRGEKKTK